MVTAKPAGLLLTGLVAFTVARLDAQWPQFRGPDGAGIAASRNLPLTWDESTNIRWKTAIHGRAWSSPVILDSEIWLTTATPDGKELSVVTVNAADGTIVRDQKIFQIDKPQEGHPFNSYASPTPVAEPGRVYVTFGSHGTAALDSRTGNVLWQRRDLECNHFRGAGSSPVLFRNLLIMHFDCIDMQHVVALDKDTGKTVWKTPRSIDFKDLGPDGKPIGDGDFRKAFTTPQIMEVQGRPLLISVGGKAAYAYEPMTGKEVWRLEQRYSHTASTRPVTGHGLIFYATGWEDSRVLAVKPEGTGDITATNVAWQFTRSVPQKPSLLLVDDLIYMVNDVGIVTCLEAKTGTQVWQSRIGGTFSASPLSAAGRIYFFDEDGKTTVIEAGRTFKILAENLLDNGFMASAAVIGDALIVRTTMDLYRIEVLKK
jgi:outer membrane protein assembly factor BamB